MNLPFQHAEYSLRKQVFSIGGKFRITDSAGNLQLYSAQKLFRLKEDIRVYADEAQTREILVIKARQIIDFSAAYDVVDVAANEKVGALRRRGLKSLIRDEWEILDAGDNVLGRVQEDKLINAMLRRFLLGAMLPQSYNVEVRGQQVAKFRQRFTIFSYELRMDFSMDQQNLLDRRIGVAMAILLAAIEGKENRN